MEWKPTCQGSFGPNRNAFWWVVVEIWTFEKLEHKTSTQCDGNADDRGDYYSSPCKGELKMCGKSDRWATSWENLFMPYANSKGADQPAHPRSLISTFVVRCLDSMVSLVSILAISWLQLPSLAEQTGLSYLVENTGLSLTWSKTPKTGFLVTRLM